MKQSLKHFKMKYFRSLPLMGDAGHPTDTASARCVIGVTVGEAGTPATGRSSEGWDFRFSALPPPGRGRPLDVRAITVEVYMRATPAQCSTLRTASSPRSIDASSGLGFARVPPSSEVRRSSSAEPATSPTSSSRATPL